MSDALTRFAVKATSARVFVVVATVGTLCVLAFRQPELFGETFKLVATSAVAYYFGRSDRGAPPASAGGSTP